MPSLTLTPALDATHLLANPVVWRLEEYKTEPWINEVMVAEIDPEYAGGTEFCEHYNIPPEQGGNAILVSAKRGQEVSFGACLVQPGRRADLNGLVKRELHARRVSLMSHEQAIESSQMEYGSISVIGLPSSWTVIVDAELADCGLVYLGSGRLTSKLALPGRALIQLTSARVLPNLGS